MAHVTCDITGEGRPSQVGSMIMCKDWEKELIFYDIWEKRWEENVGGGISSRGGHVGAGMELSPPICRVAAARAGPTGITEQISDPALKIPSIWDHSQYSYFQTLQIPQFARANDKSFLSHFLDKLLVDYLKKKRN